MIYRSEYIYKRIKEGPEIHGEEEFLRLLKAETNPITDNMLLPAFSELRLALGQNFKLDHICFLFGNGCSKYAGSKPTTDFNIEDAVDRDKLDQIRNVVDRISGKTMEEQLNALLTVQEFYHIVDDDKEETVKTGLRA